MEFLPVSGDTKPIDPVQAFAGAMKHFELRALNIGMQNRDAIDLLFTDQIVDANSSQTARVHGTAPANQCPDKSSRIGIQGKILPAELEIPLLGFNQVNTPLRDLL